MLSRFEMKVLFCMLFLSASSLVASAKIKESYTYSSEIPCKEVLCKQAEFQAKGLSRLALLDEFVVQTVILLKDLMKNVDHELTKTATGLLESLPSNCHSTRKILDEVLQKQKEKLVQSEQATDATLSNGVHELGKYPSQSGQVFEGRQNENNNGIGSSYEGLDIYEGPQNQDDINSLEDNYDENQQSNQHSGSSWDHSQSWSQSTHHQGTTHGNTRPGTENQRYDQNRIQPNFSSGGYGNPSDVNANENFNYDDRSDLNQNHQGGIDTNYSWSNRTNVHYSQQNKHDFPTQETDNYNDKNRNENTFGSKNSLGSKKYNFKKEPIIFGSESQNIQVHAQKSCKGVGNESAFWVPGLDSWCAQNCATGYCPKTHCICY